MNDQGKEFVRQKAETFCEIYKIVDHVDSKHGLPLDMKRVLEFTKMIYEEMQDEA